MTEITKLNSGLTIITDTMSEVDSVSMGFWVSVGARFEEENLNGISHLLEHMAFKGTQTRTAFQIAEQIENVGGIINAYTSREMTAYYVKVLKQNVPLALSILADIFQNSTMVEEELSREKEVIVQEIGQTYDAPDEAVFEYYQSTAYPSQSFGRSIAGTADRVRGITRETLLSYMKDEYTTSRVVVSVAGNISHAYIVEEVEKLLTSLKKSGGRICQKALYQGGDFRLQKPNEQVNLLLGFQGVSYQHKDHIAQTVLATVLGGGMSSRLFQEIREKRGLVYSVYAFDSSYRDTGSFAVFAGTGEKQVAELLPVVCEELLKATDSLNEEEIMRAKAQLRASVLMKRESTSARAEGNATDMLCYGRVMEKEDLLQQIEKVNMADLYDLAKRLFFSKPTFACLGPIQNVPNYDKIQEYLQNN